MVMNTLDFRQSGGAQERQGHQVSRFTNQLLTKHVCLPRQEIIFMKQRFKERNDKEMLTESSKMTTNFH